MIEVVVGIMMIVGFTMLIWKEADSTSHFRKHPYLYIMFFVLIMVLIPYIVRYNAMDLDESINIKHDNILFEKSQINLINSQLSEVVMRYTSHEEDLYNNKQNIEHVIAAGQLYPELKSNELYTSLMESYKQHNSNIVSGIKDYNEMVGRRRKMNLIPILGKLIPQSDFKTITNINIE